MKNEKRKMKNWLRPLRLLSVSIIMNKLLRRKVYYLLLITCYLLMLPASAQSSAVPADTMGYIYPPKTYRYRVSLKNKEHNTYSLRHPEAFLSQKALDRRRKFRIKPDKYDLPVSPAYLQKLHELGYRVVCTSKWNNTAVIEATDTVSPKSLTALSFVTAIRRVWESPDSIYHFPASLRFLELEDKVDTLPSHYGHAERQVTMLGVDSLHRAGYTGRGVTIAILDGGFYNADTIRALRSADILGTRNFVHPTRSVYDEQSHGMMVLSCIAPRVPHSLVGTAPDASFYLLVSEDADGENMIEEDYWCAALEYADSLGVDVATSSLGYYAFDDTTASHKYFELDGETAVCSRAASLAASRGLVVLNSAGNSGDEAWKKIGFPADARDMLTVGAVDSTGLNTVFSSVGNTADGRIKPNVMAMGEDAWVLGIGGSPRTASGTSFSTPILCGGVACLLQACPSANPTDVIRAVQQSGNNAAHPDNIFGYGIPNLQKALRLMKNEK